MGHRIHRWTLSFLAAATLTLGCVAGPGGPTGGPPPSSEGGPETAKAATPAQAERLRRVMVPLLKAMDNPISLDQVSVGILDSNDINAANAGSGQFFVTRGLLARANDNHLAGVLAHEVAHEDLNHVAKAQMRAVGVGIGAVILEQIFPGSGAITPLAGELLMRSYTRNEEYAADAHGADLLQRAGKNRDVMAQTLVWLMEESGPSPGGFFSTHPGTEERIAALRNQPDPRNQPLGRKP